MRPSDRIKVIPSTSGGQIIRASSSTLDVRHHTCEVRFHVWRLEAERVAIETEETHEVRFFFPMELELFLPQTGFSLLSLTEFPSLEQPVSEASWHCLTVAKAI